MQNTRCLICHLTILRSGHHERSLIALLQALSSSGQSSISEIALPGRKCLKHHRRYPRRCQLVQPSSSLSSHYLKHAMEFIGYNAERARVKSQSWSRVLHEARCEVGLSPIISATKAPCRRSALINFNKTSGLTNWPVFVTAWEIIEMSWSGVNV